MGEQQPFRRKQPISGLSDSEEEIVGRLHLGVSCQLACPGLYGPLPA